MEHANRTSRRHVLGLLGKTLSAPWRATRWTIHAFGRAVRATGTFAWEQLPEAFLLGGAGAITYGIAQIHVPAAWIAGGVLALGLGWRLGRRAAPEVKNG